MKRGLRKQRSTSIDKKITLPGTGKLPEISKKDSKLKMKKEKIGFVSLGCPKNLTDTEVMLSRLVEAGYEITPEETEADVIIINTCGFIESAKTEAIDNILDIAWLKKNAKLKKIIVCGCLVQRYGNQVAEQFPEVDGILSVGALSDIVSAVEDVLAGKRCINLKKPEELPLGGDRVVTTSQYAYLKIAEGCDNRCSYCAIPAIRGRFRSREMDDIVNEAKVLEGLGASEIILVAQDTTRYGLDLYGKYSLAELIRKITDNTLSARIRVLYCYPDKITDELCREFRENDRLIKYIDIPIQHISDTILKRMNRHGGSEVVENAFAKLRSACPGIIIRTTVIVGFPGETDEDFCKLKEFVRRIKAERLGAFTYSAEEGTPAAEMEDQIPEEVKQSRYDELMALQSEIAEEINRSRIGKREIAVVEEYDPLSESYCCRSDAEAPEIDGKIYLTGVPKNSLSGGDMVDVTITEAIDSDLVAKLTQIGKKRS